MAAFEKPGYVALITNSSGKPFRELNEEGRRTVRIPFGSEYQIRLKNKTQRRATASVLIDGTVVTGLGDIILGPGQTVDLERFLEDKNSGSRFKFVTADSAGVQDPSSWENGRVQVVFKQECNYHEWLLSLGGGTITCTNVPGTLTMQPAYGNFANLNLDASISSCANTTLTAQSANTVFTSNAAINSVGSSGILRSALSDIGATVEGAKSTQAFATASGPQYTWHHVTIDLWIKGPKVDAPKPFKLVYESGKGQVLFNNVPLDLKHFSLTPEGLVLTIKPEHFQVSW